MTRYVRTILTCAVVWLLAVGEGPAQDQAFVPGELIVWFQNEDSAVVREVGGEVTSNYESLNAILQVYDLTEIRPLFGPNSLVKNIYVFRFPPSASLDEIVNELEGFEFIKYVSKNWMSVGDVVDYIPNDYAIQPEVATPFIGRQDLWTYYFMQVLT